MATSSEVNKILAILSGAYPGFQLTVETGRVYQAFLADLDAEILEHAVKVHIATEKFFPTIAELREAVTTLALRANKIPTAMEAWGEVEKKIRWYGHGQVPEFSHPIITRVVGYMGWNDLCMSENQVADRARFLQAYETEVQRACFDAQILPETSRAIEAGQVSGAVKFLANKFSGKAE